MIIGKNIGSYRILARTKFGETGSYYKAVHTEKRQTYALKLLSGSFENENPAHRAFLEKLGIVENVSHPHIARVFPAESHGEFTIIPMEFLYGKNISEKIAEGLSGFDFALQIATQTTEALIFAHEIGLVHERLTSNNVMVNADGQVKILDFGMRHLPVDMEASDSDHDIYAAFYQKPTRPPLSQFAYQAPEQVMGSLPDERCDLFSLGVILYELLVGEFLFEGEDVEQLYQQVLARDLPRLTHVRPDSPLGWDQVLKALLEKSPSERYPSARHLMNDLQKLGQGFPLERPDFRSKNPPISRRSFFRHFMGEREY